jgi:hypothetical protein
MRLLKTASEMRLLRHRLFFGSVALAKDVIVIGGTTMSEVFGTPNTVPKGTTGPLAPSGGPSLLLPAAALLLGTGVLTYIILRRRT